MKCRDQLISNKLAVNNANAAILSVFKIFLQLLYRRDYNTDKTSSSSQLSTILEKMAAERVRIHQPPDFIINGKPKWTNLQMTEQQSAGSEKTHVVDRLNPSRNMISTIESQYAEEAETTQKVMVNMMCDLRCELVVTIGDVRLSEEQEKKSLKEYQAWEDYKVGDRSMGV